MTETPCASIIINNYNYERFLADAIDSALAQSYPNTEVIVVDDGSTDGSQEVVERYAGRVIPILKENGGQGSAYNTGFAACHGDIVCFLDADDTIAPIAMSKAIAAFDDSRLVKVEWQLETIDAAGRKTGSVVPEKPLPAIDLLDHTVSNGPFYDWLITPPGSGASYRRTMLECALPMTSAEFRHGADVYLTILAPVFGNVRRLTGSHGCYRQHDSNNYFGRALDDKRLQDYLRRFESYSHVLRTHLESKGLTVNAEDWKRRNFNYLWPSRLLKAKQDVERIVPEGAGYILVDGNELGGNGLVPGRRAIPFIERGGSYWGPPPDGRAAVHELQRLTRQGVGFIVFWWTAFWWLKEYSTLNEHLQEHSERVLDNDALKIFQLRANSVET